MEEQNIKLKKYSAYTPTENGLVENFNRYLRRKIYAGFIRHENKQWVNYLDNYIKGWNDTRHSTTGFKPNEIYNKRLPKRIWELVTNNTKKASNFKKAKRLEIRQ
jgi:hypothetical protein